MLITMLKSKIHRATVTEADLNYAGSLTLDPELMKAANMQPFEKVQILNINNGARFETYIITGKPGSGTVCLNGPAARQGQRGDIIIALTYAQMTAEEAQSHKPTVVHVDTANHIVKVDQNPD